ncbi:MAG: 50S ribosomal protein L16 [Rickettsiales bacterium]|nr:50S ribosomal protein L16 [Rickettsiales bacterium]
MLLAPSKTKYRKAFKGRIHGLSKGGTDLVFGTYGLKAITPNRISARQIEAARRAIVRYLRKEGRMWMRVFPNLPISKKPAEVRMGSGKGSPEFWACKVKPGKILFEIEGLSEDNARIAFAKASAKLSIQTRFVKQVTE